MIVSERVDAVAKAAKSSSDKDGQAVTFRMFKEAHLQTTSTLQSQCAMVTRQFTVRRGTVTVRQSFVRSV